MPEGDGLGLRCKSSVIFIYSFDNHVLFVSRINQHTAEASPGSHYSVSRLEEVFRHGDLNNTDCCGVANSEIPQGYFFFF